MFCQIHILDTKAVNPILYNTYIAYALINLWGLLFTFYEIDLLFKHQNRKFKYFQTNWGSFLQETNKMF